MYRPCTRSEALPQCGQYRAGAYAEGARSGAPQAQQIADAWHLWRNLAEAVEKTVGAHHHCIREAFTVPPVQAMSTTAPLAAAEPTGTAGTVFVPPDGTLDVLGRPRRLVARTTERYQAVQQLLSHGLSLIQISRELRLDHSTVRRFARAGSLEELLVKAVNRVSILDQFKPYLHQRWREGCHDIPNCTANSNSSASPATSSPSAATSSPTRSRTAPGPGTRRHRLPRSARPRNPAASSAGS
ncbi:hypothetical protein OG819_49595 [Streptomyces sp. NBC_01549]|uniref:hypothetical protein n=1 Tax=Streptomyces sp. NBC_01549 TaxID=2975874 RepID=UPI00224FB90B|nr:hypothetical protein [Streptomyces sp. NBC_01549]MCX4597357.1 hypothetical protein [Streptomyces sp. NBC_01549]